MTDGLSVYVFEYLTIFVFVWLWLNVFWVSYSILHLGFWSVFSMKVYMYVFFFILYSLYILAI